MEGEKSEWLSQIHVAAGDGSWSTQLTRGDKSATSPQWAPDGQSIAFLSARGGDKVNVFTIRISGGEAEQITNEKASITLHCAGRPTESRSRSSCPSRSRTRRKRQRRKRETCA